MCPLLPVIEWMASWTDSMLSALAILLVIQASLPNCEKLLYEVNKLYKRSWNEMRLLSRIGPIREFWLVASISQLVGYRIVVFHDANCKCRLESEHDLC